MDAAQPSHREHASGHRYHPYSRYTGIHDASLGTPPPARRQDIIDFADIPIFHVSHLATGIGPALDTLEHVHTSTVHNAQIQPNQHHLFYLRTHRILTIGTLEGVHAVDDDHVEVLIQFACSHHTRPSLILFDRAYVSDAYIRLSPAWFILRWAPRWDASAISNVFHAFHMQPFRADPQPKTNWVNIRACTQAYRLGRSVPTSWRLEHAPPTCRIFLGVRINLWDDADDTFVCSAQVIGIRAVEQGWIELICIIYRARLDIAGSPFLQLTVPAAQTHMPRRFRRQYRTSMPRLPSITSNAYQG